MSHLINIYTVCKFSYFHLVKGKNLILEEKVFLTLTGEANKKEIGKGRVACYDPAAILL